MTGKELQDKYMAKSFSVVLTGAQVEVLLTGLRGLQLGYAQSTDEIVKAQVNQQWNGEIEKIRAEMAAQAQKANGKDEETGEESTDSETQETASAE